MNENTLRLPAQDLSQLAGQAFRRAGLPDADAETVAEVLVTADLMGISTHGVHRVEQYIKRIAAGVVQAQPEIAVEDTAPSLGLVNGGGGQGQVVAAAALETALKKARATGISYVGVSNSGHFGATAPYSYAATIAGLILLSGTNASPAIAPFGGRDTLMGNNPLGVAAPRRGAAPFMLDMACTVAARGKMRKLRDAGEEMPLGWALDADGQPTTDPAAGLAGFIQFMGGHKGYGLALAVDLLAGLLPGGKFLHEVGDMWSEEGPQGVGHFFLAIDPVRLLGAEPYFARMEEFATAVKASAPFSAGGEVLLPGEMESRAMAERRDLGIPLATDLLETLKRLADA